MNTLLQRFNQAQIYAFLDFYGEKRTVVLEFIVSHREFDAGFDMPDFPEFNKPAFGTLTLTREGEPDLKLRVSPEQFYRIGKNSVFQVRILKKRFSQEVLGADLVDVKPPLVLM